VSIVAQDQDRRVIPRWRDLLTTISIGELDPLGVATAPSAPAGDFLASKLADWQGNKTTFYATDLVAAAFVLGRGSEAEEAAHFILSIPDAAPMATSIARKVLGKPSDNLPENTETRIELTINHLRKNVRQFREQLRDDPRNGLAWAELSRHYAILGLPAHAARAMQNAIRLAPNNRFTLRSAARLYVHLSEPDRAHHLLSQNEATRSDPWLLATEISTAMIADRDSRLIRRARALLDEKKYKPHHLTELASAMGTLELYEGHRRIARRLLTAALVEPTDNTVAQAEWASRRIGDFTLNPQYLKVPFSFEARAWSSYFEGMWARALDECLKWLNDEPFSSRPADLGSFVATVALEDYASGKELSRRGLIANPTDPILLNNLVFALASENRVDEALTEYQKIDQTRLDVKDKIPWLATGGLVAFRQGFLEKGRNLYRQAIDLTTDDTFRRALATTYLAREELIAGTPDAVNAVERAISLGERTNSEVIRHLSRRLRILQEQQTHQTR
jgi:tetratricopeptide (TPR) repeat protein